ncbi:hypothetical protein BDV93DRAFT_513766 [Ceratobasidium sp. AG-I]|nr:hypothetical protein BDV93DRAFT_513766 [Ceratobasidium sp. AG-I]
MNKLDAYNKALHVEWKDFQVTSPEEVQELEAAAKAIRDDTVGNIGDQLPAMQKSEIARTLDQWGKTYNMVSYILCARLYLNTKEAKEQHVSFEGWVTKNVSRLLSQQENRTSLQIYPDMNGMPQLPGMKGPCSARLKAQLLQRFFIAKYESQGGHNITWKRFEKESIDDMDKWIAHIHKGQKSDAEPHSIFQFHITNAGSHKQPIIHTTLQTVPHPLSRLRYTPAEQNIAKQYIPEEASASSRTPELSKWSGLPLAHTVAHFQAIKLFILTDLDSWGGNSADTYSALSQRMVISALMDEIGRNPHLMAAASVKNWVTHEDSHWLPLEFFASLIQSITIGASLAYFTVCGIFKPTVMWIQRLCSGVLMVFVFLLNLRGILMRESVPDPISVAMRRTSSGWNTNTALELIGQCVAAIRNDIERSNRILLHSFPERSRAWVEELNRLNEEYEAQRSSSSDLAEASTDDITRRLPRSLHNAHSMWLMLPDSQHMSVIVVPAVKRGQSAPKRQDMRYRSCGRADSTLSDSQEEIELPKDDEMTGSSNSSRAAPSPAPLEESLPEPDNAFRNVDVPSIRVDRTSTIPLGVGTTSGITPSNIPNLEVMPALPAGQGPKDQSSRQKGVRKKNMKETMDAARPEEQGTSGRLVCARKQLPNAQAAIDVAPKGSYKR